MQIPSRAELERFFDAGRAEKVHFIETVASWPSLRILDYLYANEPTTTGEIARALNMDMRDVKDRLNALENHETVEHTGGSWQTRTDRISITLRQNDGLRITHTIESQAQRKNEPSEQQQGEEANGGVLSRIRQSVFSLFR